MYLTEKPTEPPVTTSTKPKLQEPSQSQDTYIFIGSGVAVLALLFSFVIFFIICRRWKKKKDLINTEGVQDKQTVEEINHHHHHHHHHHIQAVDGNEYVVTQKSLPRNGCVLPQNRITITPNPLAEADNKVR